MQLKMSMSIEQVLANAQLLVGRLKEHESCADNLLSTTETMFRRIDSMKQYEAGLNQLNEMGRHRPRSNLILALVKENNQIRQLQQENKDLRTCLEEHQSAIELIMSKYREQIAKLLVTSGKQQESDVENDTKVRENMDKICEMAAVMRKAATLDESGSVACRERLAQLETENRTLRQMLKIGHKHSREVTHSDGQVQTDLPPVPSTTTDRRVKSLPAVVSSTTSESASDVTSSGTLCAVDSGTEEDSGQHYSHFVANDGMNNSVIENRFQQLFTGPLSKTEQEIEAPEPDAKEEPKKNSTLVNALPSSPRYTDKCLPNLTVDELDSSEDSSSEESSLTLCETLKLTASSPSDPNAAAASLDTTVIECSATRGTSPPLNETVLETTLIDTEGANDAAAADITDNANGAEAESKETKMDTASRSPSGVSPKTSPKSSDTVVRKTPQKQGSAKKASGKSPGMATIKRGKGKSILQDLNANMDDDMKK